MHYHRRFASLLVAFAISVTLATPALAAEPERDAVQGERLGDLANTDLAAIALAQADVPSDFYFAYGTYVLASVINEQMDPSTNFNAQTGGRTLLGYHEVMFVSLDGLTQLHSYVGEFSSVGAATRNFPELDRLQRASIEGLNTVDHPGLDAVGLEPARVNAGTYPSEGATVSFIDATFRVGRFMLGLGIDTSGGTAGYEELLGELGARLQQRAEAVIDGSPLPQIDPVIVESLLPASGAITLLDSYVDAAFLFGPAVAPEIIEDFESGYARAVVIGSVLDPASPLPLVTITIARFGSESSGLELLNLGLDAQPPYAGIESAAIDRIPGVTAASGYHFVNYFNGISTLDSFRVVAVIDRYVIVVEVQGAESVEQAQESVHLLITEQAACASVATPCESLALLTLSNGGL